MGLGRDLMSTGQMNEDCGKVCCGLCVAIVALFGLVFIVLGWLERLIQSLQTL